MKGRSGFLFTHHCLIDKHQFNCFTIIKCHERHFGENMSQKKILLESLKEKIKVLRAQGLKPLQIAKLLKVSAKKVTNLSWKMISEF